MQVSKQMGNLTSQLPMILNSEILLRNQASEWCACICVDASGEYNVTTNVKASIWATVKVAMWISSMLDSQPWYNDSAVIMSFFVVD